MMEDREYYMIVCRMKVHDRFLIWYSSREGDDGLVTSDNGQLLSLNEGSSAKRYASESGLDLDPGDAPLYDVNELDDWINNRSQPTDCELLVDFWNLFADIAASVPHESRFRALDRSEPKIYDKLFFGNNLSVMTPPGKEYEPLWSDAEVSHIVEVMTAGLQLLKEAVA